MKETLTNIIADFFVVAFLLCPVSIVLKKRVV